MQEQNASMHWMYLLYPDRGLESSAECKPDEYLVSLSSSFSQHGSATSRLMWQLSSMFACGLHPAKLRWQWTVQHLYILPLPIERDQAFQPALFVFLFCLFLRLTLTGKSSRVNIFWQFHIHSRCTIWKPHSMIQSQEEFFQFGQDSAQSGRSDNWGSMLFARLAHEIKQFEFPVQMGNGIHMFSLDFDSP